MPDENDSVQPYEDERRLSDLVARFIGAGLIAGEPVVVIATPRTSTPSASA